MIGVSTGRSPDDNTEELEPFLIGDVVIELIASTPQDNDGRLFIARE